MLVRVTKFTPQFVAVITLLMATIVKLNVLELLTTLLERAIKSYNFFLLCIDANSAWSNELQKG